MKRFFITSIYMMAMAIAHGQAVISLLEIVDVKSGVRRIVKEFDGRIEAPNWTPDGKWLVYNRDGKIYKIPVEGGEPRLVTEKGPSYLHGISPDGKKVSYITYMKGDVEPGAHPANKNVKLKMMSADGGESVTLASLFGGQGTFNVNSWSPDNKKFAFVSYKLKGLFEAMSDVGKPGLKGNSLYDPATKCLLKPVWEKHPQRCLRRPK